MTFQELKFLIIDFQRKTEIDKLFHLYVKASDYSEILQIVKTSGNYEWIFNNGFRDLIQYFPEEDLLNANIYSSAITLSDQNTDIIILDGGNLTLSQSGDYRCRVIVDNAVADISMIDECMVEIESYRNSTIDIDQLGYSYSHSTIRETGFLNITAAAHATIKLNGYADSEAKAVLSDSAFLNCQLQDESTLNINTRNYVARLQDKAKVEIEG